MSDSVLNESENCNRKVDPQDHKDFIHRLSPKYLEETNCFA